MIQNLKQELEPLLAEASRFYIATALISKEGFDFIEDLVPEKCERNYLIGIDLPSAPQVLESLINKGEYVNAKIYFDKKITYHPKVYIIETKQNDYVAFIGSGNTTGGGLSRNVEMSSKISGKENCTALIEWFKQLSEQSHIITHEFIERYKAIHKKFKRQKAEQTSDLNDLFQINDSQNNQFPELPLGQLFNREHYDALSDANASDHSREANSIRKLVSDQFHILHRQIYGRFLEYNLTNLACHHRTQNIISSHSYRRGFTQESIAHIWLNYGYTRNGSRLNDHPRLQVILDKKGLGVWLLIGKEYGSTYERGLIKQRLSESDDTYSRLFFELLMELGNSYKISVNNNHPIGLHGIINHNQLRDIIKTDTPQSYFTIFREFTPDDPAISQREIASTVLIEFQRLHSLYDLVRDKRPL